MIAEQLTEQVYNCIKCGLCVNVCPVYEQLRFEGASPRGKVQLIKKILEGELEPSQNFSRLLFTCLLCETCTVACPGGLQPDRLMKAMRAEIIDQFGLPWQKRALFHLLSGDLLLPFCMFWGRTVGNSLRFLLPRKGKVGTIPYPLSILARLHIGILQSCFNGSPHSHLFGNQMLAGTEFVQIFRNRPAKILEKPNTH